MKLRFIILIILFSSLRVGYNFQDLVSLRRVRADKGTTLKAKLQPKLELVRLALFQAEIEQAKQKFKNDQEELNLLAQRLSEREVRETLRLTEEEITHLQNILRNYNEYSSKDIKKETGFSKLLFPGLLYLWIEKGPFYKGKIKVIFAPHMSEADFAELRPKLKRYVLEAKGKNFELLAILELGTLVLDVVIKIAEELKVSPYELLIKKRFEPILQRLLEEYQRGYQELLKDTEKGILPPQETLDTLKPFTRAYLIFMTTHHIKVLTEALELEAARHGALYQLLFTDAYESFLKGDLESYLTKRWESIVHHARNIILRDRTFQAQMERLGRPNLLVLSLRGDMHQIQSRIEEGFLLEEERPFPIFLSPSRELIQKYIRRETITEEEKREKLMADIIYLISATMLTISNPSMATRRIDEISVTISQLWSKLEILQLMETFAQGGEEAGNKYFLNWVKNSSLPDEIKNLFPL